MDVDIDVRDMSLSHIMEHEVRVVDTNGCTYLISLL